MMPISKPRNDTLVILGLIAASWVAFVTSDGVARGTFVFGGVLQMLAAMAIVFPAIASIANRRSAFRWFHLVVACYVTAYLIFISFRGWTFGWALTAVGAAIALVLYLGLAISRWLGWLR